MLSYGLRMFSYIGISPHRGIAIYIYIYIWVHSYQGISLYRDSAQEYPYVGREITRLAARRSGDPTLLYLSTFVLRLVLVCFHTVFCCYPAVLLCFLLFSYVFLWFSHVFLRVASNRFFGSFMFSYGFRMFPWRFLWCLILTFFPYGHPLPPFPTERAFLGKLVFTDISVMFRSSLVGPGGPPGDSILQLLH